MLQAFEYNSYAYLSEAYFKFDWDTYSKGAGLDQNKTVIFVFATEYFCYSDQVWYCHDTFCNYQ